MYRLFQVTEWKSGMTTSEQTLDFGLFYINNGEVLMTSLIQVEKVSNAHVLPGEKKAQMWNCILTLLGKSLSQ